MQSLIESPGRVIDPAQVIAALSPWSRMNLGWRDAVADVPNGRVIARIGSNRVVRKLIVRLNAADLYDVEIGKMHRRSFEWIVEGQVLNVGAEQLAEAAIALHGQVAG
jgi:hypothetical protein